jgi:TatD DNase family protein
MPNRGKRNEPAWVKKVAVQIGVLRGLDPEHVADTTADNFRAFFRTQKSSPAPESAR